MRFQSSQLGQVDIDESTVITFPRGIPALENCTRFKLFHNATQAQPQVFWLQSLDDPGVIFSITTPEALDIRYEIELDDAEVSELKLQQPQDVAILLMLSNQADEQHPALSTMKANIRNPLVINLQSRTGLQKMGLQCDILLHNR
ncbi:MULTISPECIES: flagellar assembly protein FliW [Chromobacterium]|uniref:Flagellar assembly factor FliW n=2 Tax=Chromobacterium TaxID=535 RepID=A0A1W0D5Z0_9NEIS|nr:MULTISPECIES: flagellar assembly protein FliW [Chromobacterium]AXT47003.1 flagellar biosynthesis protein FliW [Chromobacterium rhizoryzae]OQS42368.1 flagellar biosynthesis protein FliW [Chromobacterium haemolyticum]QOZ84522.1 flagellar biosynthesis protein FliW [Chromobacterium sp. Rain0013]UGA38252.1 flagellar assembly protein FliW [Chromobacterium haemolyticum]WON84700.1 flagellar assembly protein FliW [Chromobacterium haemolyticum]